MSSKSKAKFTRLVKWSLLVGAILAIGGVVGVVGLSKWRDADAAKARELGFALFDQGKFAEALPNLAKAVARDRNKSDTEALRRLGRARVMVPEPNNAHLADAVRYYQVAAVADPSDLESRKAMLEIFGRSGRFAEAEIIAKEIVAIDPEVAIAREALLQLAVQRGDVEGALAMLEARIASAPGDFESKLRFVEIALGAGRDPAAMRERVESWLAAPDADQTLRVCRVAIMQRAGDRAGIGAELEALESVQPRSASSCMVLSRVFGMAGRPAIAKRVLLDGAARLDDGVGRLCAEAVRMSLLDDDLETARRAIALAEGEEDATWIPRARLRLAFLANDAAELDRVTAAESTAAEDRRYGAALKAGLAEKPTQADATTIAAAIAAEASDHVLLAAQARLRAATGDIAGATNAMNAAFEASGRAWVRAATMLAPALESAGDRARAAAVVRSLAEKQPGNPVAQSMLLSLAAAAAMRGEEPPVPGLDVGFAATELSRTARENPEAMPLAVVALVGAARAGEAVALVEHALADDGVKGPALLGVARACMGIGSASPELQAMIPRLLETALARGADARVVAAMRAQRGSDESIDALVTMADSGDVGALRAAAQLADARLLPRARALLERVLVEDKSVEGGLLAMQSQTASRDAELLEKAIAAIEGQTGASDATVAPRARLLLMKGGATRAQIDEALSALDDLRRRKGESSETLATMARLMLAADANDAASALRLAAQAADLAPDRMPVQLLAAAVAREAGDLVRAREFLARIVRMVDDGVASAEACLLVANEHAALGDAAEAARLAARGAEATGRSEAWLEAAMRAAAAGDAPMRERALRAAVAASDAGPAASARLAMFLASTSRLAEARGVVDALAGPVSPEEVLPIRLELELGYGDRAAATAALDAAVAKSPEDVALIALKAAERRMVGDAAGALDFARKLAAKDPRHPVALDVSLQACMLPGESGDAALAILAAAGVPAADELRELRAMRDGTSAASVARARELADANPRLWNGWLLAMDVARNLGDSAGRASIASAAALRLPDDPTALWTLANVLLEVGRGAEALAAVEQLRAKSGNERARVERLASLALLATEDVEGAKRVALRFHAETGDLDAALLAAAIDAQRGNVDGGYSRIKGLLADSPAAVQFWLARSMTLDAKDARKLLDLASEHEAAFPYAYASAWSALAVRGGLNAAERAKSVLDRAPEDRERALLRAAVEAEVELARGNATAFAAARDRLASLVPESMRGVLEGRKASTPDASEAARFVAEIAATEARLLVERKRELDRALALVDAAISLFDQPGYRLTRGKALLARDEVPASLQAAERLTSEGPMNPEAWLLLAEARLRYGDRNAALKAIERGREAAARTFFVDPAVTRDLADVEKRARDSAAEEG